MRFVKGHGTENDFVLLPDAVDLSPRLVARICDRRRGVGADGVVRVVRTKEVPQVVHRSADAEWFMDYRNADGSDAEMCGNGIRVYARYLVDAGLAPPGEMRIATRTGVKQVRAGPTGDITVDMGRPEVVGKGFVRLAGRDVEGLHISLGNPHLACVVGEPVGTIDMVDRPDLDEESFPHGGNVEVVRAVSDGRAEMRVHERGVGETRSCGTGAVAAAVAMSRASGTERGTWRIETPGGPLTVILDGATSLLSGPAELVAEGELRPDWVAEYS